MPARDSDACRCLGVDGREERHWIGVDELHVGRSETWKNLEEYGYQQVWWRAMRH